MKKIHPPPSSATLPTAGQPSGLAYLRSIWNIRAPEKKMPDPSSPPTNIYAVPENPNRIPRRSMGRRTFH